MFKLGLYFQLYFIKIEYREFYLLLWSRFKTIILKRFVVITEQIKIA